MEFAVGVFDSDSITLLKLNNVYYFFVVMFVLVVKAGSKLGHIQF